MGWVSCHLGSACASLREAVVDWALFLCPQPAEEEAAAAAVIAVAAPVSGGVSAAPEPQPVAAGAAAAAARYPVPCYSPLNHREKIPEKLAISCGIGWKVKLCCSVKCFFSSGVSYLELKKMQSVSAVLALDPIRRTQPVCRRHRLSPSKGRADFNARAKAKTILEGRATIGVPGPQKEIYTGGNSPWPVVLNDGALGMRRRSGGGAAATADTNGRGFRCIAPLWGEPPVGWDQTEGGKQGESNCPKDLIAREKSGESGSGSHAAEGENIMGNDKFRL